MRLSLAALLLSATVPISASIAAPAVDVDAAHTVRVFMTGSSALSPVLAGVVLNDICGGLAANNTTTLYNLAESAAGFTFDGNFWAITCRLPATHSWLLGLPANTPIAFFKSDAGGAAQGVFPIYFGHQRRFVEPGVPSRCAAIVADRVYAACPSTRMEQPMVGISDLEPGMFKELNTPADYLDESDDAYPPTGLFPGQLGELTVRPVLQTVFGVAVNASLYQDMFAQQQLSARRDLAGNACTPASSDEVCVPSIGAAQARSLFQGTEVNWRLLSANNTKVDTQVNVCRTVSGTGEQAAVNAHLMDMPCNPFGSYSATWDFSSSASPAAISSSQGTTTDGRSIARYLVDNMGGGTGAGPMPNGSTFVFEGPGTGDVLACLKAAEKAGGYAIGHVARSYVPGVNPWRHVRLDGVYPSRDAAKTGLYDYVFESTVQWKNSTLAGLSYAQRTFITKLADRMGKADALAKLSAANQNGVAALPGSYAGDFGTGSANEIAFGSRMTRAGNSCQPMTAYK